MGSDDLFKKRNAKKIQDHKRRGASRQPYERILIVCEGEKTEPYYFTGLSKKLSLHTANIVITGDCGSSPKNVFEKAQELFKESKDDQNSFDKVYCVFDKDGHSTYLDTISRINSQSPKNVFFAITSVPCFEYWLLLHFTYTTQPFINAESIISALNQYIPGYRKGNDKIFQTVEKSVNSAIINAQNANSEAQEHHTDNPTTLVVDLVNTLLRLKE